MNEIIVNGYVFPFVSDEVINLALPNLTFLSIFSYHANNNGDLEFIDDANIRNLASKENVKTLMSVTNMTNMGFSSDLAHTILTNETINNNLIQNILNLAKERNFYGVNIDFEYIYPEDKDSYNNFIKKISEVLHRNNLILTTALAPKTSKDQKGTLYEAHDYSIHGKYADYVILMTYEWGYAYGPPMAVSPLNKVENVLKYAVTEIPSKKILMGIQNYGYDWVLPYEKGTRATTLTNPGAVLLAKETGVTINFDDEAMSPYFNYTDNGINHVVWFENGQSIKAKLGLVSKYNLGGISYWNLNNLASEENWPILRDTFNTYKINFKTEI